MAGGEMDRQLSGALASARWALEQVKRAGTTEPLTAELRAVLEKSAEELTEATRHLEEARRLHRDG